MSQKFEVTLPQRVYVDDYHEFDGMGRFLSTFMAVPIKVVEVAFDAPEAASGDDSGADVLGLRLRRDKQDEGGKGDGQSHGGSPR